MLSKEEVVAYREAVAYIESFSNRFGDFLLETKRILDKAGNPEKSLKFIHIAGTAGKGTTSTLIHSSLVADSRKAGLFTTPYVTTVVEQIKVANLYISPAEFTEIVRSLRPILAGAIVNSFQIYFIIALIYFKEQGCKWAVIETGIGGRLDPTNVIKNPAITVITNIDYDHTDILGKTLNKIALDKAGIIKKGSLFFTGEKRPALRALFKKVCSNTGAVFHDSGDSLVACVCSAVGVSPIPASLPCRFESMGKKPFVILDGAHDRIKIRHTLAKLKQLSYSRLFLVLGLSGIKADTLPVIDGAVPYAHQVIATSLSGTRRRLAPAEALAGRIPNARVISDPFKALDYALGQAQQDDCILVTGSFFLAGELRKRWYPEEWILEHRKSR